MGTTADKLRKMMDNKAAIKAAIESKGQVVGDNMSEWASSIMAIQQGSGMSWEDISKIFDDNFITFGYSSFTEIPQWLMDYINIYRKSDNLEWMLTYCKMSILPPLTKAYRSYNNFLVGCTNLVSVQYMDFSVSNTFSNIFGNQYNKLNNLTSVTMDNLGTVDVTITANMQGVVNWDHDSMIDSLYTRSFDRASAGYTNKFTIQLAPEAKARLSEDEIAMITAKGFTIS